MVREERARASDNFDGCAALDWGSALCCGLFVCRTSRLNRGTPTAPFQLRPFLFLHFTSSPHLTNQPPFKHVWTRKGRQGTRKGRGQASPQDCEPRRTLTRRPQLTSLPPTASRQHPVCLPTMHLFIRPLTDQSFAAGVSPSPRSAVSLVVEESSVSLASSTRRREVY